jgi:hypothetical protein
VDRARRGTSRGRRTRSRAGTSGWAAGARRSAACTGSCLTWPGSASTSPTTPSTGMIPRRNRRPGGQGRSDRAAAPARLDQPGAPLGHRLQVPAGGSHHQPARHPGERRAHWPGHPVRRDGAVLIGDMVILREGDVFVITRLARAMRASSPPTRFPRPDIGMLGVPQHPRRSGAVEGPVDGGAADGEDFHEVGDGVFAGGVHAGELGLLAGGELGLLAA